MPVVKVTKVGKAASGKPIAYFDGKEGRTDGFLVSDKCHVPVVGMTIDADTKSWEYRGATYWGLNGWRQVTAPNYPSANEVMNRAVDTIAQNPSKPFAQTGWDIQSGDLSRYASNIVASAITAGLIKTPSEIAGWAKAAYMSGNALKSGYAFQDLPDPNEDQDRDPDGFDDKSIPF